ncbi:MAG: hypothetical protein IJ298_03610 [Ruminococcus sp.]|nr:hypothetical protein [Ruminococcus sp.]
MSIPFSDAYVELLKLSDNKRSKVCIVLSTHMTRVRSLVDFLEKDSPDKTIRFSLSEIAKLLSPAGKYTTITYYKRAKAILEGKKPDYIIIEDLRDIPHSFDCFDKLFELIAEVGEKTPVILISESATQLSTCFEDATLLDVAGLNEYSLKIKASPLDTVQLYDANRVDAIASGIFHVNHEFYEKFLMKKREGDAQFEQGNLNKANQAYLEALSFHNFYGKADTPINNFLTLVIYLRFLGCEYFGPEENRNKNLRKKFMSKIDAQLEKLTDSVFEAFHSDMLYEYKTNYEYFCKGIEDRTSYLLLLKEYIF